MDLKASPSTQLDEQQLEQIPNRSISSHRSISSQLIPPVTTNRKQPLDEDELNKNISLEYQDIQIRTLTKWINVQLAQVDDHITNIAKDLRDGKKLLKLLSVVANQPTLKPERGNMRIHELSNVAQALKFLKDQWGADSLPAVASEAIVNGDVKSTLAITFYIMLKYQIHPILLQKTNNSLKVPSLSRTHLKPTAEAKLALLEWVKNQLEDYTTQHIIQPIQDFSRSWRSGLAFCLLLHRHDPDLLPTLFTDLIQHASEKDIWHTFLALAFDVAERELNVPQYLEPEDLLLEFPHEPSVMMYVSELYKVMTDVPDRDTNRSKRLRDIQSVAPPEDIKEDSKDLSDDEEETDESPGTPQTGDIHHQLDLLSSLIQQHKQNPLPEDEPSRLLNDTDRIIHQLNLPPKQKQQVLSRYRQLKSEWEWLSQQKNILYAMIPKNDEHQPLHPLDGTLEIADNFERALAQAAVTDPESLAATQRACQDFRRGVMFAQITHAINEELDVIQHIMGDRATTSVTDEMIQGLENRIHVVSASIEGVREEYEGLVESDTRYGECLETLEERYETVCHWVDQVRVWFKEADRIRSWIDRHIKVIEERNQHDVDPVSREMTIEDTLAYKLHHEHEKLKQEIDRFDSDDMDRLRSHVKMLTHTNQEVDHKELTPADTSTIEITLTTLNMLSHLTKLLDDRSRLIQLLLLRVKWEELFAQAVQWIATTDQRMDIFLRGSARWTEKDENEEEAIEEVIQTLVSLERQIADFDQGSYAEVLDAYQEMEAIQSLPDYLEMRQSGFEQAFEDVMKRSGFSRKVVEQLLSMIGIVNKFKELRDVGEALRQHLLGALSNDKEEERNDVYAEQVQIFKEESARLITNASTSVPYPVVPAMSTAIGANDGHDTDVTNERIKSTISAYSMSLALLADALDQLLMSRYQVISLQSRVNDAFDAMNRTKTWFEDRIKLLQKSRFDVMLYDIKGSLSSTTASSPNDADISQHLRKNGHTNSTSSLNPTPIVSNSASSINHADEFHRLEKERDNIALKLHQIEQDELARLFETVGDLENDVDALNAVSIDRNTLVNCVESLEQSHEQLKQRLALRGLELEALKRRVDWETQWSKTNSHLQTIARKTCDFNVKKARYDPAKENPDKPSYQGDHEITQSLHFLQDRVVELDERYLTPLADAFVELTSSYSDLVSHQSGKENNNSAFSIVPEFITTKQSDLKLKYDDLRHLMTYTTDLVTQRSTITEFLIRARDANHDGEKIKDALSKKTRRIMSNSEEEHGPTIEERVEKFKQEIKSIWDECGKTMPYPVYNGAWLKSVIQAQTSHQHGAIDSAVTNSAYRSQVRTQVKNLLDKKMDELYALEKAIDQGIESYREADRMKALVNQYEQEAFELSRWVNEQLEVLKNQYVDVSAEVFLPRGVSISDLKKDQMDMILKADHFENEQVVVLHNKIAHLVEYAIGKNNKKAQSVDVSTAARHLGEVMEQLEHLKRGLSDQAVTLEAASKRAEWEEALQSGISRLEEMNEQVSHFTLKKNQLIAQDELTFDQIQDLQEDLTRLAYQKNKLIKSVLPGIQLAYDTFVEYFPQLSRPMAIPDHLEARMESLNRSSARLQENVEARSTELELIKQRMRWEDMVKKALEYLANQEIAIENFIEDKARWQNDASDKPNNSDEDDLETALRTEWSDLFSSFKAYEEDVIQVLQKRFKSLVAESTDHYNNTSIMILPNAFMKKMEDVQNAQNRTNYYFDFSNDVVTQRCLVSAFILRTVQLEQSAELIREEFITSKSAGRSSQLASLLEKHAERLEKFKTGVDDVRSNLAASIPFPVRSIENVSTQAKIRDETTNAVIKETIQLRNNQLDEIWSSLQQLLETKERVSRRGISIHTYKKQAQVTEAWINSRHEILSQSNAYISPAEEIDVEKLKDAVSQVDSIEKAMKASDNLLTTLNSVYEKCITAFEDTSSDEGEAPEENVELLAQELNEVVKPTQERLNASWNKLLEQVVETNKDRQVLLIKNKIQVWSLALEELLSVVSNADKSTITEDQLNQFVNSLDQLKNKDYLNLKSDVDTSKESLGKDHFDAISLSLAHGIATAQAIQDNITLLQNRLQLNQWVDKYIKDIAQLQASIETQTNSITTIYDTYQHISIKSSPEKRSNQHQTFVAKYKLTVDCIVDLKQSVNDITNQYNTIVKEDGEFDQTPQNTLQSSWDNLLQKESAVTLLTGRSSKWVKLLDILNLVQADIKSLDVKISQIKPEETTATMNEINRIQQSLNDELKNIGTDLIEDTINFAPYEAERQAQLAKLSDLKTIIKNQLNQNEKLALVSSLKENVDQICKVLKTQLAKAESQCQRFQFNALPNTIPVPNKSTNSIIDSNKVVISNCQNDLDVLKLNQCTKLSVDYNCSESEIEQLLSPAIETLDKLNTITNLEQQHLEVESRLHKFLAAQSNVVMTINNHVSKLSSSNAVDEVVSDIEHQFESVEESIQELETLRISIEKLQPKDLSCRSDCLAKAVSTAQQSYGSAIEKFDHLKLTLHQTREKADNLIRRQQILTLLNDMLQLILDMTERVNSFQITGKGILSEERELYDMCNEFYQSYNSKNEAVEALIKKYSNADNDEDIKKMNKKIKKSMEQLESVIEAKKKLVSRDEDLTGFLSIMDEFEKEIALVVTAINHASPHYSSIVNNKFVKTDLQALLKNLVTSFKQHKKTINGIFDRAREESKKQFLEENSRAKEMLEKATKRWALTQKSAAARERELQTCISQLDHEFFTKLAMAKTAPHITHRILQSSSKVISSKRYSTPSENSKYLRVVSPIPTGTRRESSSSTRRSSKTPVPSFKRRALYVPDPENELDIKLSEIVNSSPYKITVKIVPDQVGKYWFGDVNPRLVYCRILPSQLVMVRVGGGWVELSKFLIEHGIIDSSHSRSDSSSESSIQQDFVSYQDSFVQSMRSSSPSGRITIRGGGNSSSLVPTRSSSKSSVNLSKSPIPGYVDGNKFVSHDEAGNQYIVKMKKANDDAKTPTINKKKH